ncbi:unnamed protein product [Closterium sp. NIES-64]|nr:unnamed protein product [Closterium sp. NIES-64]
MCHATRSRIHTLTPSLHSLSTPSPPSIPSPFPRILTPSPPPPLPPSPTLLAAAPRLICTKVSPVDVARSHAIPSQPLFLSPPPPPPPPPPCPCAQAHLHQGVASGCSSAPRCRQWMWRAMQWREDARSHPFPPRSPQLATFSLICTKVSPVDVARNAVDDARSACMRTYGSAPELRANVSAAPDGVRALQELSAQRAGATSPQSPPFPPSIPSPPVSPICTLLHRTARQLCAGSSAPDGIRALLEVPACRAGATSPQSLPSRLLPSQPSATHCTALHRSYVPTHLHQMVFELCKNSLRAVQERFADADTDPPPIRVVVADGIEDVTIKISDEGGGIPHSGLPHIRTYLYSTARLPAATSHSPPCHLPPCDVCPPHPTHPFQISDEGGGIPRSGLPRIWTYLYSTARSPAAAGALQDTPSIMCVPVVGWLGGGSGEMLMCGGLCTIAVPSAESPSTSDDPLGAERQYRGVRQRRWGRWVSEIREPRRGLRIWLGSHSSAEQAARVYDVAVRLLRGDGAILNFPNDQREVLLPPAIAETLIHACAALSSKDSLPDADSTAPLRPLLSSAHTRVAPSSSDSLPRGATAEPCAALAAPGSLAEEGVSLTAAAALMGTGTGDSAGSGGEDEQRGRQQVAQEQAEGEQVEEEQAGEEQAEGEQGKGSRRRGAGEGEQAEGEQGEGEQAEGEQAKEEQVVEEQAEGEQQGGEQEWQVDWLLACEQLPLDEFTVCDSEPEGALLARAPLAAHTLCGDSGTTVSEAVVGVGEESGRGGAAMGVKGHVGAAPLPMQPSQPNNCTATTTTTTTSTSTSTATSTSATTTTTSSMDMTSSGGHSDSDWLSSLPPHSPSSSLPSPALTNTSPPPLTFSPPHTPSPALATPLPLTLSHPPSASPPSSPSSSPCSSPSSLSSPTSTLPPPCVSLHTPPPPTQHLGHCGAHVLCSPRSARAENAARKAHDSAASMPTPESSAAAPAGEGSAERRDGGAAEAADGAGSAQGEPFLVLNFYHFADVEDAHGDVERHRAFLQERDIRGRIYISHQGINAQQSGLARLSVSRSPLCRLSQLSVPASHVMDGVRAPSGCACDERFAPICAHTLLLLSAFPPHTPLLPRSSAGRPHMCWSMQTGCASTPHSPIPLFQSSVPLPITSSRPPSQLSDPASHVNAVRRLSGPASHVMEYAKWVRSDQRFAGVPLQLSPSPHGPRLPAPPPALQARPRAGGLSCQHYTVPFPDHRDSCRPLLWPRLSRASVAGATSRRSCR